MFEWDPEKRRRTLEKHGVDFIDAIEVFDIDHLELSAKSDAEVRCIAVGRVGGRFISVVFTRRGETMRLITARSASRDERRAYRQAFP